MGGGAVTDAKDGPSGGGPTVEGTYAHVLLIKTGLVLLVGVGTTVGVVPYVLLVDRPWVWPLFSAAALLFAALARLGSVRRWISGRLLPRGSHRVSCS